MFGGFQTPHAPFYLLNFKEGVPKWSVIKILIDLETYILCHQITFLGKRYAKNSNDSDFWHTFFLKR